MKKCVQKLCLLVVMVICCFTCFVGCGKDDPKVEQEVYTGKIQISANYEIPVELIIDDCGTFTLISTNQTLLPIGFLGMGKRGLAGVCNQNGDDILFERLDGKQIATAKSTRDGMIIDYSGLSIELSGSKKTFDKSGILGAYKGYVNDDTPFELRLVVRPDNKWCIIEEDGDVNGFGYYKIEGSLITLYQVPDGYIDEDEVYAFGTVDGDKININRDGDNIFYQKINS